MAAAVAVPTATGSVAGLPGYQATGTIAISASPATYTTGGIVMNLNQAAIKASRTPQRVYVSGLAGYTFVYVKGTTNANGLLMIFVPKVTGAAADDPMIELTNALAIPAALSGDTINFVATYAGME